MICFIHQCANPQALVLVVLVELVDVLSLLGHGTISGKVLLVALEHQRNFLEAAMLHLHFFERAGNGCFHAPVEVGMLRNVAGNLGDRSLHFARSLTKLKDCSLMELNLRRVFLGGLFRFFVFFLEGRDPF